MFNVPSFFGFRSGGGGFDSDAQAFFNRVDTATGVSGYLTLTEKNAVNDLVIQMKADGIWTKMKAFYPMVGGGNGTLSQNQAACEQNLKSSSFTGTFTAGWTFASTGVTPNGTSAYMDTGLTPSSSLTQNSTHVSFYSRTSNTLSQIDIGVLNGSVQTYAIYYYGSSRFTAINAPGTSSPNLANTLNLIIESRFSSSESKTYKNGILVETKLRSSTGIPAIPIYLGAGNFDGSLLTPSTKECAFASIGDGLTDNEAGYLYNAVNYFQVALNRNV